MKGFNFKIQKNKPKKLYEILLNNVNNNLVISVLQLDCLPVKKYQKFFDLSSIQNLNKYFSIYDSIDEILDELEGRINDCCINFDDNNLLLKFKIPNKKFKEASFKLDEIKDKDEIILELFYKNKELSEKKDNYKMKETIKHLNDKIEEQNKIIENLNQINLKKIDFTISKVYQYEILNEKKDNFKNIKIDKSNKFEIKSIKKENNNNIDGNSLFSNYNKNSLNIFSNNSNNLFGNNNNNSLFNENNSLFSNSIFSKKSEINNNSNIFDKSETNNNVFLYEDSNSLFNENRRNNVTNLFYSSNNTNFRSLNDSNFSLNSTIQEENADDNNDYIVYVTNTGRKYHSKGCSYLRSSAIPKKLSHVKYCYSPCSRCCP